MDFDTLLYVKKDTRYHTVFGSYHKIQLFYRRPKKKISSPTRIVAFIIKNLDGKFDRIQVSIQEKHCGMTQKCSMKKFLQEFIII